MTINLTRALVLLASSVAACGGTSTDLASERPAPEAPNSSPQGCLPEPVWKDTSERIAISSFGFWEGSTAYDIARSDLTREQLELLSELCEIAPPAGPLGDDFTSYRVTITDRSGESITYRAVDENIRDSDERDVEGDRTLDIHSLEPFLKTYHCASAKGSGPNDLDASSLWNGTPVLTPDPGCSNGIFVGCAAQESALRRLTIDAPGRYELSTERCFETLELRLFASDEKQRLATAGPSAAPDCPAITHELEVGSYFIEIVKTTASPPGRCGDFALRVAPLD